MSPACETQHRQNEPAGQLDIPTRVEVCVMGDDGRLQGPETSNHMLKTTRTE